MLTHARSVYGSLSSYFTLQSEMITARVWNKTYHLRTKHQHFLYIVQQSKEYLSKPVTQQVICGHCE